MPGIEWTDKTWNPATGCSKVSPGCKNCYAETMAHRLQQLKPGGKYRNGFRYTEHEDAIGLPLKWKRPCRVFVNSMSDFFHEDATWRFQYRCLDVMRRSAQHAFQILTKRPMAAARFVRESVEDGGACWPPNVWLGTSVESAAHCHRVSTLAGLGGLVPVKFVSFEPLLGPIDRDELAGNDYAAMQWAIVGGESGPGHRPIGHDWVRGLRDASVDMGVRFFFKQWGGIRPKSGGRELDGRTWDEMPPMPGQTLVEALG